VAGRREIRKAILLLTSWVDSMLVYVERFC